MGFHKPRKVVSTQYKRGSCMNNQPIIATRAETQSATIRHGSVAKRIPLPAAATPALASAGSGQPFFVWVMWELDLCRWRSKAIAMAVRLNLTDQGGNANACQQSHRQLAPVVSVELQLRQ